ncbi:MAG: tetratricopeptide repeat protein [bacterium]
MTIFRPRIWLALGLVALVIAPALAQQIPLDALLRGGRIHFDGQRFERAREQFQKALDEYGATADGPALGQIHVWLGLCDAQLKNPRRASGHFLTAFEKDSGAAGRIRANEQWQYYAYTSLMARTREDFNAGQFDSALVAALAAVKVDPEKPQAYSLLASTYSALGRHDQMRGVADDLLRLDSLSAEAFSLLGLYFLQKPDSLWPTPAARIARWDSTEYFYDRAIAVYTDRMAKARKQLGTLLKTEDPARIDEVAGRLTALSRQRDQAALESYITRDLGKERQLVEFAQVASQLYFAATSINTSSARAGAAMLRAAAEARGDTSERYRARAEALFAMAVRYDSTDFTALFDLGLAQYQGGKDSASEVSMQLVITNANLPLTAAPAVWLDSLLALATPEAAAAGFAEVPPSVGEAIDSTLAAQGRSNVVHSWIYFPNLKSRKVPGPVTIADTAGAFLSSLQPSLLEQIFLWLGSSQTALGSSLSDAKRTADAKAKFTAALVNLQTALKLNPNTPDAYQNMGICYRELGENQKAFEAFQKADKLRKQ